MNKIKEFIKNNFIWIILFLCIIAFLAILEDIFDKEIITFDTFGYEILSKYLISDTITPIAKFITTLGSAVILLSMSFLFLIIIKNRKIGLSILGNLVIVTGLNLLLKNIVQRPRPVGYRLIDENGYSFPSGHAMVNMAFYGYLIYLVYKYVKNKYIKWILIVLLGSLILGIGVSRIYLGVHYTSDVLAGFLISLSYLIVYVKVMKKYVID